MTRDESPHLHGHPSAGIGFPLIFLAIGVFCFTFPEALLNDPAYTDLPKRSFAAACGLVFMGGAVGMHAYSYWGRKGYARVSHYGRLIGGFAVIGAFIYMLKCIIDADGWPW